MICLSSHDRVRVNGGAVTAAELKKEPVVG